MNSSTKSGRMLVTGAGGMVGSYLEAALPGYDLVMTDTVAGFIPLDVRDPAAVMDAVATAKPDVVLHLAAATDVDRCEREPDWAFHSNAIGTQNVALACQRHGATMVYVSTGGVFWGDQLEPYTEFDTPRPPNVYGRAKLAGEHIVESLLQQFYIVRAGWMIGGGPKDKKFVGKMVQLMRSGPGPLLAVSDQVGSPTYAKELVGGIHDLLATGYYGRYHLANQGTCSRYDVALEIRSILQLPHIQIEPVSSAYFPLAAPRGRSEALRNLKLDLLGINMMQPWQEALRDYVLNDLSPVVPLKP